jgi:maltooligosyltrehalose trehalohydrolase
MLGDRLTSSLSFEALKLTAAVVLLSPQVPLLFMGEEYGEKNPFQYFISHTDADLVKMVQDGRRKEFSYFNWQGDVPDPQAEKTFTDCKLSWGYEKGEGAVLLAYYKHLISFRMGRVAMQGRSRENVSVDQVAGKKVIVLQRNFESDTILIVFNFENEPVQFSYPLPEQARIIFDSAAQPWALNDKNIRLIPAGEGVISANPESVLIFEL